MKCKDCPNFDKTQQMCLADTTELEDNTCLLRLIYWTLNDEEGDEWKYQH